RPPSSSPPGVHVLYGWERRMDVESRPGRAQGARAPSNPDRAFVRRVDAMTTERHAAAGRYATTRTGIVSVLPVLLLFGAADAAAQSSGRITGRVLDQTGAALGGVAIHLVV